MHINQLNERLTEIKNARLSIKDELLAVTNLISEFVNTTEFTEKLSALRSVQYLNDPSCEVSVILE